MVPKRLKAARIAAGFTQEKLGVLAGIEESTARARISYYESGTYHPNFDTACRLAAILDVPESYLYTLDDDFAAKILEFYCTSKQG